METIFPLLLLGAVKGVNYGVKSLYIQNTAVDGLCISKHSSWTSFVLQQNLVALFSSWDSSNNIYSILERILVWLVDWKSKHRIFHSLTSISKIRGNVLSLPNQALGGLPSTVLAAPPATPDPAVRLPPASGRQLLPLEKWLQSLRWGTVPEHGQCRSSGVFCIALLSPPAGTRVRVSLLTENM